MSHLQLLWQVTRWEFSRWFKLRDQLLTLFFILFSGLLFWGGTKWLKRIDRPTDIALINHSSLQLPSDASIHFSTAKAPQRAELEEAVANGEIDGLLIVEADFRASLLVRKEPLFLAGLQAILNRIHQDHRLTQSSLTPALLEQLFKPVELETRFTAEAKRVTKAELILTAVINGSILLALFLCLSYQFAAITGEKQSRITEQIISAVPPQMWIDGKILGVSLLALVSLFTYGVGMLLFVWSAAWFGTEIPIDWDIQQGGGLLLGTCFALGGFLMWNACFAGIAATINDPNTSARSSLLFLPLATLVFGFFALKRPDASIVQFLSVFPLTAPSVMPVRLLLGKPAIWQVALALALLLATAWFFRRLAGSIFGLSMLMYGKEPSFREIIRWLK